MDYSLATVKNMITGCCKIVTLSCRQRALTSLKIREIVLKKRENSNKSELESPATLLDDMMHNDHNQHETGSEMEVERTARLW